jgi:leucyl aminopeptidase
VHAGELEPDAIVDIATLTGAAVVALGDRIGVLMASDDDLAEALLAAGRTRASRCGACRWRPRYGDRLEGAVADLRNTAGKEAGTIYAGLFLHRFVPEGCPGPTSTSPAPPGPTRAAGIPARTLLAWLSKG